MRAKEYLAVRLVYELNPVPDKRDRLIFQAFNSDPELPMQALDAISLTSGIIHEDSIPKIVTGLICIAEKRGWKFRSYSEKGDKDHVVLAFVFSK